MNGVWNAPDTGSGMTFLAPSSLACATAAATPVGRAGDDDLPGGVVVGDPDVLVGAPAGHVDLVVVEAEDGGHRARLGQPGVVHRLGAGGDEAHAVVEAERAGGGRARCTRRGCGRRRSSARCRAARRRRAPSGSSTNVVSWALRVSRSSSASASRSSVATSRSATSLASSTSSQLSWSTHGRPMPGRCDPWPGNVKASIAPT